MRDLILEAMMKNANKSLKNGSKSQQSRNNKNEIDLIIDKLTDEYIDANSLLADLPQNSLTPVHLQRAKLKEELKASAQMPELEGYLTTAFTVLLDESTCQCLDSNKYKEMKQQLLEAKNYLAEIDFSKPLNQNFATLLHLVPATLETIFTIAQKKFNENKLDECLSIFALLTTLDPADFDYWYRLGIVAYQSERYPLAINAFLNATHFNSDFLGSRIFATDSYLKLKHYVQAKAEFSEVKSIIEKESLDPSWTDLVNQIENDLKAA